MTWGSGGPKRRAKAWNCGAVSVWPRKTRSWFSKNVAARVANTSSAIGRARSRPKTSRPNDPSGVSVNDMRAKSRIAARVSTDGTMPESMERLNFHISLGNYFHPQIAVEHVFKQNSVMADLCDFLRASLEECGHLVSVGTGAARKDA